MLVCNKCNWQGVNLVPDNTDNTARCPKCGTIFVGIEAHRAQLVTPAEEAEVVRDSKAVVAFCEAISSLRKK